MSTNPFPRYFKSIYNSSVIRFDDATYAFYQKTNRRSDVWDYQSVIADIGHWAEITALEAEQLGKDKDESK